MDTEARAGGGPERHIVRRRLGASQPVNVPVSPYESGSSDATTSAIADVTGRSRSPAAALDRRQIVVCCDRAMRDATA